LAHITSSWLRALWHELKAGSHECTYSQNYKGFIYTRGPQGLALDGR
jgi:hypothetical protein